MIFVFIYFRKSSDNFLFFLFTVLPPDIYHPPDLFPPVLVGTIYNTYIDIAHVIYAKCVMDNVNQNHIRFPLGMRNYLFSTLIKEIIYCWIYTWNCPHFPKISLYLFLENKNNDFFNFKKISVNIIFGKKNNIYFWKKK